MSHHTTSLFLKPQLIFYPQFGTQNQKNNNTCLGAFIFCKHSTQEPASSRVTYFTLRVTGTSVSHDYHRKNSKEVLEKMQVNGLEGSKLARKKSLAVSVACMAIYWPTPGFKGRIFQLCVLNRWDFNFCIRSFPQRGESEKNTHNQ